MKGAALHPARFARVSRPHRGASVAQAVRRRGQAPRPGGPREGHPRSPNGLIARAPGQPGGGDPCDRRRGPRPGHRPGGGGGLRLDRPRVPALSPRLPLTVVPWTRGHGATGLRPDAAHGASPAVEPGVARALPRGADMIRRYVVLGTGVGLLHRRPARRSHPGAQAGALKDGPSGPFAAFAALLSRDSRRFP